MDGDGVLRELVFAEFEDFDEVEGGLVDVVGDEAVEVLGEVDWFHEVGAVDMLDSVELGGAVGEAGDGALGVGEVLGFVVDVACETAAAGVLGGGAFGAGFLVFQDHVAGGVGEAAILEPDFIPGRIIEDVVEFHDDFGAAHVVDEVVAALLEIARDEFSGVRIEAPEEVLRGSDPVGHGVDGVDAEARILSRYLVSPVRSHSVIQLPTRANQSGPARTRAGNCASAAVGGRTSRMGSMCLMDSSDWSISCMMSPVRSSVVR